MSNEQRRLSLRDKIETFALGAWSVGFITAAAELGIQGRYKEALLSMAIATLGVPQIHWPKHL
ncbi:MAG: hypothetical protein WC775_00420 [Patescibacteria group bacterium]|jgi:hypothetical protein